MKSFKIKCFVFSFSLIFLYLIYPSENVFSQADGCTSILVGKLASDDGSVITSHTCDSGTDRTWINIIPHKKHKKGEMCKLYDTNIKRTVSPDDFSIAKIIGEIPQVKETFGYINSCYPCMNEHQLAIGESTFGGRRELRSDNGLINCPELYRLVLERCKTAREAIKLIDELTKKYGYIDGGECFTIADTKEVWHLEILGPGKGRKGAVWAAQRIPDDHVGVVANASRIRQIDLDNSDYFMASDNVFSLAEEMGWWNPESGKPFEFCYAYSPRSRTSMAGRRREWRVFDLLAPSLNLDPNSENYPFSVIPDNKVSIKKLMDIFRDTYEGTEYDMTKFMVVPDDEGNMVKSPYANPFMPYDMMPLFKINGGWNRRGERTIARSYCTYIFISQSRDWLPDEIGGIVWLGHDNPAMTAYAPIYCSVKDLPKSYKINGREKFRRDCAWWAFNRVSELSAQRWGDMRVDVRKVWDKYEKKALNTQKEIETKALSLYNQNRDKAIEYLTGYTNDFCNEIVKAYWELGDLLWTKYYGKF